MKKSTNNIEELAQRKTRDDTLEFLTAIFKKMDELIKENRPLKEEEKSTFYTLYYKATNTKDYDDLVYLELNDKTIQLGNFTYVLYTLMNLQTRQIQIRGEILNIGILWNALKKALFLQVAPRSLKLALKMSSEAPVKGGGEPYKPEE